MSEAPHSCEGLVFVCSDFRIHDSKENYYNQICELADVKSFDVISWPGSVKEFIEDEHMRRKLLTKIEFFYRIHHIKKIILTNHLNCSAYGKDGTPERLGDDLRKMIEIIKENLLGFKFQPLIIAINEHCGEWKITVNKPEKDKDRDAAVSIK